ncbi:MAG: ferrous iron transport protein A [Crenarchaeota archaeon]|jgi:Fe2+ transport system protein FeoA|nr:ferrous iron transport protein A [Thermoproteota archaeon]
MITPLCTLTYGTQAKIKKINGGLKLIKRLNEMGLTIGTTIKVVSDSCGGPVLIEVRDSRLAIGRGVSTKIYVEE